jgi:hypothetical protein
VTAGANRPLTPSERRLAEWMLEHGSPEAATFLSQLADAEVTSYRCLCGCASFNLQVRGRAEAPPGVHVLGEFLFGGNNDLAGIFIFSSGGILSGVEVYGLGGENPRQLPTPEDLRPYEK